MTIRQWLKRSFGADELDGIVDLVGWRENLARIVAAMALVLMPVAALVSFPGYLARGQIGLVVLDLLVWLAAAGVLAARARGLSTLRAAIALFAIGGMATSYYVSLGPFGPRPAWLVATVVLAALLFGFRGALVGVGGTVGLLFALRALVAPTNTAWHEVLAAPFGEWVNYVVNTNVLVLGCGLAVASLMRGLSQSLTKERDARQQLLSERAELRRAYDRLVAETEERQRLEKSLRQAQKLEALGRLAGGVAHDLNNLLVPIVGFTDLIPLQLGNPAQVKHMLDHMRDATDRARGLVNQMLLFSREVPPANEYVPIAPLLRDAVNTLDPAGAAQVAVRADTKAVVLGNRTALFQVFLNLLKNGLAAIESTSGTMTIEFTTLARGMDAPEPTALLDAHRPYICVAFTDTGVGMDAETAAHVFEPFFSTRPWGKGTGLGLATSHSIVSAFDGRITLDTQVGRGTTFRVFLPQAEAPTEGLQPTRTRGLMHGTGTVLVVDDNPHTLSTVGHQLDYLGFTAISAATGAEALAVLGNTPVDLVLTDLQMPGMDGIQLATSIRATNVVLPIIVTTGYADNESRDRAAALGIGPVLSKPFTTAELSSAVTAALSHDEHVAQPREASSRAHQDP